MGKPYNGFSDPQRSKAARWLSNEVAQGRAQRPTSCMQCGQREGKLEAHSEDYSSPFGPHIGAFHFCFWCHRMLHLRFSFADAFERYVSAIAAGATFPAVDGRSSGLLFAFARGTDVHVAAGPPRDKVLFRTMPLAPSVDVTPPTILAKMAAAGRSHGMPPGAAPEPRRARRRSPQLTLDDATGEPVEPTFRLLDT